VVRLQVEALRRKLVLAGRPASSGDSLGGVSSGMIGVGSPTASSGGRPFSPSYGAY
jgi:hypothetical protein